MTMKLPCGWRANFDDRRRRVNLRKRVNGGPNADYAVKRVCMLFEAPFFLRRIDPATGYFTGGLCDRLPPDTKQELLAACQARWPAQPA